MKSTAALVASTYGYILQDKYEKVVNDLKTDVKQIVNVRPFLFANTVFAARRRFSPERAGKTMERLDKLKVVYQKLDSDESFDKWNAGALQVGLIHPASAGHGLNLQSGGNTLVWFGLNWSLELYQQTVARLWRQGQKARTVVVEHIVTVGTIDERIVLALKEKDKTQQALIDAVKAEVLR